MARSEVVIEVDELGERGLIRIDAFGELDMMGVNTPGTRNS